MNLTTFIIVAAVLIGLYVSKFLFDLKKDDVVLKNQTLPEKFNVLVDVLNTFVFQRLGKVNVIDRRSFNLYQAKQNQIIFFQYATGHLTVTWKYKYLHHEVVHEEVFANVRDITSEQQQLIAENLLLKMTEVKTNHIIKINKQNS